MRCSNCGWNNPDGASTCQKCNQPLNFSPIQTTSSTFNPRATMVELQQSVVNPRETMIDPVQVGLDSRATQVDPIQSGVNTRETQVDVQIPENNSQKTMVDFAQSPVNPRATIVDIAPNTKVYQLFCMDDELIGEIQITSSQDLGLSSGDIIFAKNLRYKVI